MSNDRQVVRVIINGEGLDIMGGFANASLGDWRALIMDTGRGASAVKAGVERLQSIDPEKEMTGAAELSLLETMADLVFLAKRVNGGRDHWETVINSLSYFETMQEFGRAFKAASDAANEATAADPTTAPTDTARGDGGEPITLIG